MGSRRLVWLISYALSTGLRPRPYQTRYGPSPAVTWVNSALPVLIVFQHVSRSLTNWRLSTEHTPCISSSNADVQVRVHSFSWSFPYTLRLSQHKVVDVRHSLNRFVWESTNCTKHFQLLVSISKFKKIHFPNRPLYLREFTQFKINTHKYKRGEIGYRIVGSV